MPVKPRGGLPGAGQVACIERARLGLDCEREAGRGNRDAVDIPGPAPRERVLHPPPLRLQPAEHPSDLTLGPSADTAASGQPSPATSVHRQSRHHDQQQSGQRRCSGAGSGYRQRTSGDRSRASCPGAAQTPSLLAARKARPEHPNKLAAASDTLLAASSPGSTCSCRLRHRQHGATGVPLSRPAPAFSRPRPVAPTGRCTPTSSCSHSHG